MSAWSHMAGAKKPRGSIFASQILVSKSPRLFLCHFSKFLLLYTHLLL